MSEVLRGNLGRDLKFFPSNDKNQAMLAISVAEQKFAPPTVDEAGKQVWADAETVWHNDVVLYGKKAERFNELFTTGDSVILVGDLGEAETYETKAGEQRTKQKFYVNYFGPDAMRSEIEVVRRPKAEAAADPALQASQAAETNIAADLNDATEHVATREALVTRVNKLVEVNRMSALNGDALLRAFDSAQTPDDAQVAVSALAMQQRLPTAELLWVTSVVDQYAGSRQVLSWEQAEHIAQTQAPAPAPQPVGHEATAEPVHGIAR